MAHSLESRRLLIRTPEPGDAEALVEAINHPEVARTTLMIPYPYSINDANNFIAKSTDPESWEKNIRLFVFLKDSGRLAGGIGLDDISRKFRSAEIGYWCSPSEWGKGITTEAALRVIQFAFEELDLNRIFGRCFSTNRSSARVQEKAGMKFEGVARAECIKDGEPVDMCHYAILRSEWDHEHPDVTHEASVVLETERMMLRTPGYSDLESLLEPINDPEISANSAHIPYPFKIEDAEEWYFDQVRMFHEYKHVTLLMFLKDNDELVGSCWFRTDQWHKKAGLAYWVARKHWNKGLATEACRRMIRYGFDEMELERIEASIIVGNDSSVRAAEKIGMTREGTALKEWWREETPVHCHHYVILKPD